MVCKGLEVIFSTLLVCLVYPTAQATSSCAPLSPEQLEVKWKEELVKAEQLEYYSFWAAKPFLELTLARADIGIKQPAGCSQSPLNCNTSTDDNCVLCQPAMTQPSSPSNDITNDVSVRSVCPWHYIKAITGYMRYPATLWEARCNCTPTSNNTCPCSLAATDGNQCEAVYTRVPLLANTNDPDVNGTCRYDIAMYNLQVGCTCAVIPGAV